MLMCSWTKLQALMPQRSLSIFLETVTLAFAAPLEVMKPIADPLAALTETRIDAWKDFFRPNYVTKKINEHIEMYNEMREKAESLHLMTFIKLQDCLKMNLTSNTLNSAKEEAQLQLTVKAIQKEITAINAGL
uniref:Uncharacterized protein n=1 Tax=Chromera velia CCMP2878 TaxID=1169474 RepID=A0A0G4IE74_9ALVE|eukprot:Cvel_13530.t1-p1 / transcript=Cvel_13530.t1 / gene=Cvel_13530 / organism=Chromera_velia_CCMP2878 / gene_product=hypothetical protein / transcript_product=hypothetical protein / location=Cvel_scaffold928:35327-35722(+) / protein_length=132 / sequence_SO=supercontig / SO=protein_coding / is_pseudo=false